MAHERGLYTRTTTDGHTRWYVRIVVNGALRRFAPHGGFPTKKQARDFLAQARADIARGLFFPDQFNQDPLPLATLLAEQSARMPVTPNTKNDRLYERWWSTLYGEHDARALTTATIDEAKHRLREEKKTPQTVHHYLKFLRHRLALALRDEQIDRNPFHKLRLPSVRNMRHRYYSQAERQALYQHLEPEWREAAELAGQTGLRWSEQFTLRRDQIHLDDGYLELPRTKAGQPQVRLLNSRAQTLVQRQLARHHDTDFLYPSGSGLQPIDHSNFYKQHWQPACRAAGITNARWNDWRHTFASDLTMAGHSDRTVADLLGHTTTQMVKRYAHLTAAHLRQAVESVANPLPTRRPPSRKKQHK